MKVRAIIAVELADGTLLASNVACDGDTLGERLDAHFRTFREAVDLINLGDLVSVTILGEATPAVSASRPVLYADLDALDAGKLATAHHVHLFCGGGWVHFPNDERWLEEQEDEEHDGHWAEDA